MRMENTLLNTWGFGARSRSTRLPHRLHRISETLYSDNDALVSGSPERQIPPYRFLVASSRERRERAYRFAYKAYEGGNLVQRDGSGMVVSLHDAGSETFTLLAEDEQGETLGTISLVFDSERGLPSDEIYSDEVALLRGQGRKAAEVTRLALKKDVPSSRELIVRLFNLIYIYTVRVRGYWDFVIEVNPRHLRYYEQTLAFEQLGGLKSCPRVEGAPAVLARLDLSIAANEVKRVGGMKLYGHPCKEKTLYPWFWTYDEEEAIASHLAWQYQPMGEDEAAYFGLAEEAAAYA